MKNIPINLLYSFVVFNDSKNIMEAANKIGITQPALTKQLKQLENQLPHSIFSLRGRKKVLTRYGNELHLKIKERIGCLQEIINQTSLIYSSAKNATIRISGRRGVLDRIISRMTKFEGRLFFIDSSSEEIINTLNSFNTEFGITHTVPLSYELISKPLFKEEFQLVIPKKYFTRLPSFGVNLIKELIEKPCIGYKLEDEILKIVCNNISHDFKKLNMVRTTENYLSISEMVKANIGWAIIPSYIDVSEKLVWPVSIPSKVLHSRQFYLVYRREMIPTKWFQELTENIRSCF